MAKKPLANLHLYGTVYMKDNTTSGAVNSGLTGVTRWSLSARVERTRATASR